MSARKADLLPPTRSLRAVSSSVTASGLRRAPLIATALCVVLIVFGVLLERVILSQSAFKLATVRRQLETAQGRHEELLLEASGLASPDRIEHFARTNLGMVDPVVVEYIVADVPAAEDGLRSRLGARTGAEPPGAATAWGSNP
jgi:cell division protein FtsL